MSTRDPHSFFTNTEARTLSRIKNAEQRLQNIERRGSLAQWNKSFAKTITGDGVATSFVIDHNLGTRDIMVSVVEKFSPYTQISTGYTVEMTTQDSCLVSWDTAPANGDKYRVLILAI